MRSSRGKEACRGKKVTSSSASGPSALARRDANRGHPAGRPLWNKLQLLQAISEPKQSP
jgi:hypothetical protein